MPKKQKKDKSEGSACDWHLPIAGKKATSNYDRIWRHRGGCRWTGVIAERYKQKDGGWSDITRNILIGKSGESTKFHLRYFELASGGYSSLESHRHEHVVICIRGKGKVRLGSKSRLIKYLDTVYVAPNTVHQLYNPYNEPFGFFCIVNARRDKPRLIKAKN
ncbi:MAG TPA: cupin domain-containing protein [Dissulfurispiraceae bacterium]|nr:cupin domain-containing protein [Dissulfurispiraceae bacterium]